jgi:hypothetical protein
MWEAQEPGTVIASGGDKAGRDKEKLVIWPKKTDGEKLIDTIVMTFG